MPRYRKTNFNQTMLVPVNLEEQIIKGTIESVINDVIDRMDINLFEKRYQNEEVGAPAYNPRILLKIILYGYSRGLLSSRRIAQAAETNITFIALSGYSRPDFTTIASFISSMTEEISFVFLHVLRVCNKMNLIGAERFAIDGHKVSSNAAKECSGTFDVLKTKLEKLRLIADDLLKQHKEVDSDELKKNLKIRHNKFKHRADTIEAFLKNNEKKVSKRKGSPEPKSNTTDNESAKLFSSHGIVQGYNGIAVVDGKSQVIVAAEAYGSAYEGEHLSQLIESTDHNCKLAQVGEDVFSNVEFLADTNYFSEPNLKYLAEKNINSFIPDPFFRKRDSRFTDTDKHKGVTGKKIYQKKKKIEKQGYTSADFIYDKNNDSYICKNNKVLVRWGNSSGGQNRYGMKKQNCQQCPLLANCMPKANSNSRKTICVPNPTFLKRKLPYSEAMRIKIDSEYGKKAYSKRLAIAEPPFANIRHHKKMNYFTLRTKKKVNIQWNLFAIINNLSKIANAIKKQEIEIQI